MGLAGPLASAAGGDLGAGGLGGNGAGDDAFAAERADLGAHRAGALFVGKAVRGQAVQRARADGKSARAM